MALLLQALREVRNLSGDFDLLPTLDMGNLWDVGRRAANFCKLHDAAPLVEHPKPNALPGDGSGRMALVIDHTVHPLFGSQVTS